MCRRVDLRSYLELKATAKRQKGNQEDEQGTSHRVCSLGEKRPNTDIEIPAFRYWRVCSNAAGKKWQALVRLTWIAPCSGLQRPWLEAPREGLLPAVKMALQCNLLLSFDMSNALDSQGMGSMFSDTQI